MKKKTLVLGASGNPSRYSFLALQRLQAHQHPVVAIGSRKSVVGNIAIETEKKDWKDVDTVTLYLNPSHQKEYYQYIL
ncbi:MAG: CoA-binding protein, partial [Chitinophagaceae bacterium]